MNSREYESSQISGYRRKKRELEEELAKTKTQIEVYEKKCRHDWTNPTYDPIVTQGHKVEAFIAGSDSTPAFYVPEHVEKRWRRECLKCGRIEYTKRSTEKMADVPEW